MIYTSQLEQRTVILARLEATYGEDIIAANLQDAYINDALMCSAFDIKVNPKVLERANYSPSLSKDTIGVGQMLAQVTFKTEFRASGTFGVAPRVGSLLQACGFSETSIANTPATTIGNAVLSPNAGAAMTAASVYTKGTAPANNFDTYRVTCTTGGAAGTAKFMVTSAGFPEGDNTVLPVAQHSARTNSVAGSVTVGGTVPAPTFTFAGNFVANEFIECYVGGIRFYYQVVAGDTVAMIATALAALMAADARLVGTAAAAGVITVALSASAGEQATNAAAADLPLGNSGAIINIPVVAGNYTVGDYFDVPLYRPGVRYDPISDSFPSLTLYCYLDGTLFVVTGARGTVTVDGMAAEFPTMSWTFTGIYNDPIDAAMPNVSFEFSRPAKVELSQLTVFGLPAARAQKFAFDIANTISPKDDINASEGYYEIAITDRKPSCSADPESTVPSVYNPWYVLRREDSTRFHASIGARLGVGNIARIQADNVQYDGAPYANRNGVRALNYGFRAARLTANGNDECFLHFS
jgi:hypothetical protein